ncbi:MAG: SinR family protein [Kofleriaceae bacterium]
MHTFLISYDLRKPGRKYDELYEAIKKLGTWARPLESVWMVRSGSTSSLICDELKKHVDATDGLLVVMLADLTWSTLGVDQPVIDWLKRNQV